MCQVTFEVSLLPAELHWHGSFMQSGTLALSATNGAAANPSKQDPVIVWYKHDLRTHDHPGLTQALSTGRPVIAFFCFDANAFYDQKTMLWGGEVVRGAVLDLQVRLASLNVPLVVRSGSTVSELLSLVERTGSGLIYCEDEVEHQWVKLQESVQRGMTIELNLRLYPIPVCLGHPASSLLPKAVAVESTCDVHATVMALHAKRRDAVVLTTTGAPPRMPLSGVNARTRRKQEVSLKGANLIAWRAPIWAASKYVDNFKRFQERRGRPVRPLPAPQPRASAAEVPGMGPEDEAVPSLRDWDAALAEVVDTPFRAAGVNAGAGAAVAAPCPVIMQEKGGILQDIVQIIAGGESVYRELLEAYLAADDTVPRSVAAKRIVSIARQLEAIPGNDSGSFTLIFQPALALGMLSRREVYTEAATYERGRNGGFLPLLGFTTSHARAAARASECGDYHVSLAQQMAYSEHQAGDAERRFWRWNGQITDYLVAEPTGVAHEDAPTVLLVHGFGAFAEHWRRNIPDLAARGFRVFACTLPGFGPSEKSPQLYTTATWAAFVRDFVINVVRGPCVIGGNSIGGVIPANAAADHPHLFQGVVLINTAGSTDLGWDPDNVPQKKKQSELVVNSLSWLVFNYLQRGISKQLEKLYPTRPFNADRFLNDEIFRASCDPCALQVLRSGFYLAPPRPLPYLMNELYGGPVLVVQGVLDPLNAAETRANLLEERIERATKVCIDAGHCPHDEVPELVNDAIADFTRAVAVKPAPVAA